MAWVDRLVERMEGIDQRTIAPYFFLRVVQYTHRLRDEKVLPGLTSEEILAIKRHQFRIWLLAGIAFIILIFLVVVAREFALVVGRGGMSLISVLLLAYSFYVFLLLGHFFLVAKWFSRYFADSIAIGSLVYCLRALLDENVLDQFSGKEAVQRYLHQVSTNTRRMIVLFPTPSQVTRDWARRWLGRVSDYLLEREKWVITPDQSTAINLRNDLARLLPIYLSGKYDDFKDVIQIPELEEDEPPALRTNRPSILKMVLYLLAILVFVAVLSILGTDRNTLITLTTAAVFQAIAVIANVPGLVNISKLLPTKTTQGP